MAGNGSKNFSIDARDCNAIDQQIESIGHPIVKQVVAQVLCEQSHNEDLGSAFGEGVPQAAG